MRSVIWKAFVFSVFWVSGDVLSISVDEIRHPPPFFKNVILVDAIVESTEIQTPETQKYDPTATLRVKHVYCGPRELVGSVFTDISSTHTGSGIPGAVPVLKAGQNGIWALRKSAQGLTVQTHSYLRMMNRIRDGVHEYYPDVKTLAETIETISKLEGKEQSDAIDKLCVDRRPLVSYWATRMAIEANAPVLQERMEQLAGNKEVGILTFSVVDDYLTKAKGKEWLRSPKRMALLEACAQRPLVEFEKQEMVTRMRKLFSSRDLDNPYKKKILAELQQNASLCKEEKEFYTSLYEGE